MGCINSKIKNDCIQNTTAMAGEKSKNRLVEPSSMMMENPTAKKSRRVVTVFGKKSSSSSRLFFNKGGRTTTTRKQQSPRLRNSNTGIIMENSSIIPPTNHDRRRQSPEIISPNTPTIVVDPAPAPAPAIPACSSSTTTTNGTTTTRNIRRRRVFTFGSGGGGGQIGDRGRVGSDPELTMNSSGSGNRRKKRSSDNNSSNGNGNGNGNGEKQLSGGWRIRKSNSENEDWVLRIIRCFPFPSPKESPKSSPFSKFSDGGGGENASTLSSASASGSAAAMERNNNNSALLRDPPREGNSGSAGKSGNLRIGDTSTTSSTAAAADEPSSEFLTLGRMVRNTIQITLPPLVPWDWDKWLRKRLVSWIQCAGHEGTVVPATEKTVWKKCSSNSNEAKAYQKLMQDATREMAPKFYKEVDHQGECFLELEDLSRDFVNPSIMDVKIGVRTFLEREVKNESKRADLYQKMIAIDPQEPSQSERDEQAITKLRYMTFREELSSTASLGFRIDALKMSEGQLQKNFQRVKALDQVMDVFRTFFGPNSAALRDSLLLRLYSMREKIEQSQFFQSHEVIGSSVLIMHDRHRINAWIIDFANAVPLEEDGGNIDHRSPWKMGNGEDGYLFGLDNLIKVIEELDLDDTIQL